MTDSDKADLYVSYSITRSGKYELVIEDVVGDERNDILAPCVVTRESMVQLIMSTVVNVGATDVYVSIGKSAEPARLSRRFVTEVREGTLGLEDVLL